jgi:hypothetical protein
MRMRHELQDPDRSLTQAPVCGRAALSRRSSSQGLRSITTMGTMTGRECYHCKQWVEEGEAHDCWTTTEAALTQDLSEELQDAWERLRETAVSFGDQRIYASHT